MENYVLQAGDEVDGCLVGEMLSKGGFGEAYLVENERRKIVAS